MPRNAKTNRIPNTPKPGTSKMNNNTSLARIRKGRAGTKWEGHTVYRREHRAGQRFQNFAATIEVEAIYGGKNKERKW
jgi:hypothetical protein